MQDSRRDVGDHEAILARREQLVRELAAGDEDDPIRTGVKAGANDVIHMCLSMPRDWDPPSTSD